MPYLGIFGLEFWKTIVMFETSTLKFVWNESLNRTVNFGIKSAFSKGRDPLFLKNQVRVQVRFAKYALKNK